MSSAQRAARLNCASNARGAHRPRFAEAEGIFLLASAYRPETIWVIVAAGENQSLPGSTKDGSRENGYSDNDMFQDPYGLLNPW